MTETNFKHTDLGLIPHDWEVKTLGELVNVHDGTHQTPHYVNVGVNFYSVENITNNEFSKTKFISEEEHALLTRKFKIERGDVLMTRIGSIGVCKYIDWDVRASFYVSLALLKNKDKDRLYMPFLAFASTTKEFKDSVSQNSLQFAIPLKINLGKISDITFPLPPTTAEQERIADALSSIDTLIGALTEQIEKKRHIKQGAMQQLLTGKKRLAGFTGEWIEKSIDELGDLTGAGVDKTSKEDEIPVRLVNYLDVFHRDTIYNRELNFWVTANETKLQQCNVKCGDVFFTPSSEMPYDIALSAVAMEDMRNVCYSYHIYRLRFKENIDLNYRAYMFKAASFYEQANTTCEGSGKRYVISLTKFKKLSVYYPVDIAEQRAIAAVLSGMDTEIAALEQKRDKYIAIKSGMMQNLLTGKIRLV